MRLNSILIGLVILTALIPTSAQTWGVVGLSGGGGGGGAFCSNCGSGNLVFCWEVTADNTDITQSGGCSVGDTTATAASAVALSAAPTGKTGYAVTWSTSRDYYAFDVDGDDLVDDTVGTVTFDVYITDLSDFTNLFTVQGLIGEDELYIEMYNTDELRLIHEGGNAGAVSARTSGADLQLNTWYSVTAKWRTGSQGGNPTLSINVNNITGTSTSTLTPFTNQAGTNGLMLGNPTGTTNGAAIKNIKIYNAWVD